VTRIKSLPANPARFGFGWIDQIKEIRDPRLIDDLNRHLIARLKARQLEKVWMAAPEVLDWVDVKGFRYARAKRATVKDDLDIIEFLDAISDEEPTIDLLKDLRIYVISAKSDDAFDHWTAYRCIYAEIEEGGKIYVLNNGKWYEIAPDFAATVHSDFQGIPDAALDFPAYEHTDEGAYNESLPAAIPRSHCMDCKTIPHGGGHSSIEFCDLATEDKKLGHIKRYSGSSQLSHLFSQGGVSAKLFVEDAKFREALNQKLPEPIRLADAQARPVASDYEIVFAIISKSTNRLEISFFSKVSLKNARRRLQGYGYRVAKKKILRRAE